jgi:RNA polymerase sigma-70 factor (ECF subfamily)
MKPTDTELVALAHAGDRDAFGILAKRYRPLVERRANRLMDDREAAADCVQATFVRAWERLSQLRENDRFANWLLAICRSVAANMREAESVRREREADAASRLRKTDDMDHVLTRLWVHDAIAELPELYRHPVSRFYLEGFPQREIAHQLGVPLGTVKARLYYARSMLRAALSGMEEIQMEKMEFTDLMEAFMEREEPEPQLSYEELALETLKHYNLGELRRIGSVYRPSDSIGIAIETDRGQYRLWRYQPWMTRELVQLQHAMLRHLQEKSVPVKRLVTAANGETTFPIDNHFVAIFEWFSGMDPELRWRDTLEALGELHGRWVSALADFDPPIKDWRKLTSSWRPRKGWALALPFYDLPMVPERMGIFKAARDLPDPPPYHDEFLRGVRDTEVRLQHFAEQVEAMGMKQLPHSVNHGVVLLGKQDFDLMVADADDYVYEPRIGDLGRLLHVIVYELALPGYPGYDKAKLVLDAFQRHVALSEAELRALPWVCLSFALFYRVFHVLLYLGEIEDSPEGGRYLVADLPEKLTRLAEQEGDIGKLTEVLLGSSC